MAGLLDKRDKLIIFIFLGLVVLFFSQVLFTQATYIFRDIYHTFYPTRYFVSQCVKDGYFPPWNPYIYFGFPFFGSLQHGLLNPLSIFMYVLPFDIGFKLFIIGHFCLAGIFMYLLMRDWRIGKAASLIAAITYTFNGYLLSIDIFTHLTSACWTPLIFLFYNKAINSSKFKYIIFTSISLAFQFLGEKPEILYTTVLTLILFTIAKAVMQYREEGRIIYPSKSILILSLVGLISVGLVLFQLLPFLEAVNYSYRQEGMVYHKATKWSLPPIELLTLICPASSGFVEFIWKFWGQDFFKSIYLGIIGIFLVMVAIFEKRKRNVFWVAIFFGSIILALGINTPFYNFLYNSLPGISFMRYPVKFFCLTIFAGGILAGFGFDYLLMIIKKEKIKPLIFLFGVNFLLLIILIFWYINIGKILFVLKLHYLQPPTIDGLIAIEGNYFMTFKNFSLITIFFSIFNSLILLTKIKRINLSIFSTISIFIIIVDLFFFGLNLNPLITQKFYSKKPPVLKILKKDSTGISRFMIEPRSLIETSYVKNYTLFELRIRHQSILSPNFGLMHKVFGVQGYGFLVLKDYFRFEDKLSSGEEFSNVLRLLNLTNVKYIISKFEIPTDHLKLIYMEKKNDEEIRLYENPNYLKRAFFVPKARVVKDRQEILNILTSRDFEPQKEVILEGKIPNSKSQILLRNILRIPNKSQIPTLKSQIQIIDYQPNKVAITTSSNQDGFLFLSDTYYPGWKAYVDGKPTKIYRANFLFRAIVLPMGIHKVEFIYSPLSFKIGFMGTIFTLLVLIVIGLWKYTRNG
ncbi:MAG: YfhO family protein [bacterium]